jgi:hypothetical protein
MDFLYLAGAAVLWLAIAGMAIGCQKLVGVKR